MRITTNKGYDVDAGVIQGTPGKSNGRLYYASDKTNGRRLWVYEIQTGFSLSGSTGQSYNARSFFPRNRIQQSITVLCQCPNQEIYGDTVEWIRASHKKHSTSVTLSVVTYNMPVKGQSQPLLAEGYIKSVPRAHNRFEYAPELRFDFLVERVDLPADWKDNLSEAEKKPRVLPTWKDVIEKQGVFRRDPDEIAREDVPPAPESQFHDSILD